MGFNKYLTNLNYRKGVKIGKYDREVNKYDSWFMIFDELEIGDILVCIEKDDYYRMREGIRELFTQIKIY